MKFREIPFSGEWERVIGRPELTGSWIVWGQSGSGKTSFMMQLVKYLTQFQRVYYNSIEEGASKSMQAAFTRVGMAEVKRKLILAQEEMSDMIERLSRRKSPNVVVIDTVQYFDINKSGYKRLMQLFPNKLFIWVSHAKGREPETQLAQHIRRLSNVKIYTEGYVANVTSRYNEGGDKRYTIWEEGARQFAGEF